MTAEGTASVAVNEIKRSFFPNLEADYIRRRELKYKIFLVGFVTEG
jgi:hypothetical protein